MYCNYNAWYFVNFLTSHIGVLNETMDFITQLKQEALKDNMTNFKHALSKKRLKKGHNSNIFEVTLVVYETIPASELL